MSFVVIDFRVPAATCFLSPDAHPDWNFRAPDVHVVQCQEQPLLLHRPEGQPQGCSGSQRNCQLLQRKTSRGEPINCVIQSFNVFDAVAVAQMVERLPATHEVCSLNPTICKNVLV